MRSSTGRWVGGDDFFDREADLQVLKRQVEGRNHVLLTGQRRMGKTSVVRELGRQLEAEGWAFLFTDVEGATCPEDAVASIAQATHSVRPIARRFAGTMGRLLVDNVEEVSALDFRVKVRANLDAGTWRRHGEQLLRDCAEHGKPVLLAIDELPIFLKRMHANDGDPCRVEEFLSWLRGALQELGDDAPVLIVSGSVGLQPLVRTLGISDRINHLYPYRLGPWNRATSIKCFEHLAKSNGVPVESGVAQAVYAALGIGIPYHVQSFFARLSDFLAIQGRSRVKVADVETVYRTELLGPSGQSDLAHYESRLRDAFDEDGCSVAMKILAEAAIQCEFTMDARRNLITACAPIMEDPSERIAEAMEVLEHDGYLIADDHGHQFSSHLLRDWWAARFQDHHTPLDLRGGADSFRESEG